MDFLCFSSWFKHISIHQIKTFTYEIPNDTKVATNKNFSYKNEYYNSLNSSNTYYPERDVPAPTTTTHYTNESHNTVNRTENGMPTTLGPNQTYFYKKETNETKNNVYGSPRSLPPGNTTTMYESNVSNTQNVYHPPGGVTVYPDANLPPHQPGTKQTYLYKKETTNTTNTVYEPNGREYVPTPESATNKYYKYSSQSNTTNTHSRPEPIVAPFPTDAIHQPTQVDGPPKNLGQLLASFEEVYILHRITQFFCRLRIQVSCIWNDDSRRKKIILGIFGLVEASLDFILQNFEILDFH